MKYALVIMLSCLYFCCDKSDCQEPPVLPCTNCPDTMKLDSTIEWQVALHTDSAGDFVKEGMIITDDKVIYITQYHLPVRPVVCRNINTGKELWRWVDPDGRFSGGGKENTGLYNNTWITSDTYQAIFLNINSGNAVFNERYDNSNAGWPRSKVNGDCFYHIFKKYGNSEDKFLVRINIDNPLIWDTLYQVKTEGEYKAFLEPPSLWLNPDRDSCLAFSITFYNFSNHDAKERFVLYNINKSKEEWRIDDYVDEGQNSVLPIIIYENKAYVQGQRSFHCIDLINKKEIWKRNFFNNGYNLSFSSCNAVIAENKLITKSEQEDIRALDLNDGHTIWENLNVGASPNYMEYYNGMVYFDSNGSGGLWGVRVSDGALRWKYKSPNKKINSSADFFYGGVAVDKVNNRIIASDGFFLMSIKLPK